MQIISEAEPVYRQAFYFLIHHKNKVISSVDGAESLLQKIGYFPMHYNGSGTKKIDGNLLEWVEARWYWGIKEGSSNAQRMFCLICDKREEQSISKQPWHGHICAKELAELIAEEDKNDISVCDYCGEELMYDWDYCPMCGEEI